MFVLFLLFSQGDCEQERWNFTIKGIVKRPRLSVIPGTHYKKVNLTLQLYTLNNIMCWIQDDLFYIWKCHFNFWSKIFFFFFFAYLEYLLIRPTAVPSWTPRGLQNTEIQNPEIGKPWLCHAYTMTIYNIVFISVSVKWRVTI